ncbi:MAG: hypothetical protein JWQ09_4110 [Segetibacter sp.]|nr:hypothetical protein [Segetibacter sp.]
MVKDLYKIELPYCFLFYRKKKGFACNLYFTNACILFELSIAIYVKIAEIYTIAFATKND